MKIPQKFPQFEKYPALFVASGEYEARFYITFNGDIEEMKAIKMSPREEAREKQGFIGHKGGMADLSSVSHHENYMEDLKSKFAHKTAAHINDLVVEYKLDEVYVFAPKYVTKGILSNLNKQQQKKIRMQFYKEYTKYSPLKLIESFMKELEEIQQIVSGAQAKQNLAILRD